MTLLICVIFLVTIWIILFIYATQEGKELLNKYNDPLSWNDSNNTIKMIRKLQNIYEHKTIKEEDIKVFKLIVIILKTSWIVVIILFALTIIATIIFNL